MINIKTDKDRKIIFFLLIVLLINIILVFIVFFQVSNAKKECLDKPLIYGINKLSKDNRDELHCYCNFKGRNGRFSKPIIYVNSTEMVINKIK